MAINKDSIERFLANKASREEAEEVYAYLKSHPDLMGTYLGDEEWPAFDPAEQLDDVESDEMWGTINRHKKRPVIRIYVKRWLQVAAVFLLVIGGLVILKMKTAPKIPAEQRVTAAESANRVTLRNDQQKPVQYILEDGSVVVLSAKSRISFSKPFDNKTRHIDLSGEASFDVAKDSLRPFTVYAKDFSTTALGTLFIVRSYPDDTLAYVRLMKGKVVVKNLGDKESKSNYLLPGQECSFNSRTMALIKDTITGYAGPQRNNRKLPVPVAGEGYTENDKEINFKNTSLPIVFGALQRIYQVEISCSGPGLSNRKYTGNCLKSQSPDEVLQTITLLNNLVITKDTKGYHISR